MHSLIKAITLYVFSVVSLSSESFTTENSRDPNRLPPPVSALSVQQKSVQRLLGDLRAWARQQNVRLTENFSLDRRFSLYPCSKSYKIEKPKPDSSIVQISCDDSDWKRHLSLPTSKFEGHKGKPSIFKKAVWVLKDSIAKGGKITDKQLVKRFLDSRKVPKNFATFTRPGGFYARRDLRAGKLLLKSDFYNSSTGLVAKTFIPRGTEIKSYMTESEEITSLLIGSPHILKFSELEYMETNKPIRAGQPILATDMRKAKLVKRGEIVVVSSIGYGFEIKAKAKALGDGYFGDQVTFDGEDGRRIRGTVSGRNHATAL